MAESARTIAKKAGSAAVEKALESLMPAFLARLDRIDASLSEFDRELHGLRQHIDMRFNQARDGINELGQRMARVEEAVQAFSTLVDRQSNKMDQWIERLVRVELGHSDRPKKRRMTSRT
jgi:hypothetical protein